jgi:hypothetical protein
VSCSEVLIITEMFMLQRVKKRTGAVGGTTRIGLLSL